MTQPSPHSIPGVFAALDLTRTPSVPGTEGHDVQFYRTDAHLVTSVVEFLAGGLRYGQPLIVIATEPHRSAFADGLRAKGFDLEEAFSGYEATWLDARETLDAFMEGRSPNRELFMATVGRVFERTLKKRTFLIARGYGEMVDLLSRDGNTEGAMQLEALWNELADRYSIGLLCAYAMESFREDSGESLLRICRQHSAVLPLELH